MVQTLKKKRMLFSIMAVILVLALIFGTTMLSGQPAQARTLASATVERGDIVQTVTATGHLITSGGQHLNIPANLQVEDVYVQAGDIVVAGTPLARFDLAGIHSQIAHIQSELDRLDDEIADIQRQSTSRTITAGVSGTLDEVFAEVGDFVTDVMIAYGALAHVVIEGLDAPIAVTGTTGEITRIHVDAGASVSPNTVLFTLTSMETLPAHSALFTERAEHAAVLADLISLSQTGILFALSDGIIEGVMIGDNPTSGGAGAPSMPPNIPPGMFMGISYVAETSETTAMRLSHTAFFPLESPEEELPPPSPPDDSVNMQEIASLSSISLSAPIVGATPETTAVGHGFTATIQWMPEHSTFEPATIYRAVVLLQPNANHIFGQGVIDELTAGTFPAEGASILGVESFGANLAVMIAFPATDGSGSSQLPPGLFPGGQLPPGLMPDFNFPSFNLPSFSMPSMPDMNMGNLAGATNSHLTTTAFLIASGDFMELRVSIDERDILSLAAGQDAEILLDALPGTTFHGTINRINVAGATGGGSARYTVELVLPRAAEMLPGMSASAVIITYVVEDVLLLPVQAVQEIAGREFVFMGQTSAGVPTDEQDIVSGISDGLFVEIVSGLSLGDTVYYEQRGNFTFPHWGPGPGPGWGG